MRLKILQLASVFLLAAATYVPALECGTIWDDDDYVTENEALTSFEGLKQIWTEPTSIPQYYPLVHTTYWLEYRLWGLEPMGYHATNVLLHATSCVLLLLLLRRLKIPGAWFAAALFAVHPVQVESVAWITERKNVLSGVFYLSAAMAWFRFRPPPGEEEGGRRIDYALALAFFLAALFSKTVTSSLPAAILLVTWFLHGRLSLRRDVFPLLPFFALGLVLGLHTAWLEKHHVGAAGPDWDFAFIERVLIAGRAMVFYFFKLCVPHPLMFIYPRWEIDASKGLQYVFPLATAVAVVSLWVKRHVLGRGPLVAALFFIGSLLPASGLFDVYPMRFSFVADHFQYLASLGPIVLFAAIAERTLRATKLRSALALGIVGVLVGLSLNAQRDYVDQTTLWQNTLEKNPEAWIAHDNLGYFAQASGNIELSTHHFRQAARLRAHDPNAHNTFGTALYHLGRLDEAEATYRKALALDPDFVLAHENLAHVHESRQEWESARRAYRRALEIEPGHLAAHIGLGNIAFWTEDLEQARAHYSDALEFEPDSVEAHLYTGMTWARSGRAGRARDSFQVVLRLDPENAAAKQEMAALNAAQGR